MFIRSLLIIGKLDNSCRCRFILKLNKSLFKKKHSLKARVEKLLKNSIETLKEKLKAKLKEL